MPVLPQWLVDPVVSVGAKSPLISTIVVAALGAAVCGVGWHLLIQKYQREHPPVLALTIDVGPFRVDEFRPGPDNLWVFHQFTIRVHHPTPNALEKVRAEITAMEPHFPQSTPLPIDLRIRNVGIHEAVVDVVRVNVTNLKEGLIQWCGKSLLIGPPDTVPPGMYSEAQTGLASRGRYAITITVAAGNLSARRNFILEPGLPRFSFIVAPDGVRP